MNTHSRIELKRALRAIAATAAVIVASVPEPSRAATLVYDLGAGCTTMTVAGRAVVCNDGSRIALDTSVTPSCPQFSIARVGANYALVCATPNATGLWWRADQDGRGTWISHQGDTMFAVDYAYDATNAPRWRTLIGTKRNDGMFSGDVIETRGPSFSAPAFDSQQVAQLRIGIGWIAQDDADHVRVDMAEGNARALTRQQFGPLPACSFGLFADPAVLANATDLWWNPAESGWGIALAQQEDTIFAAWYTYHEDRSPLFLVATTQVKTASTYTGDLYRVVGPAGPTMEPTMVGTATLAFTGGNSATFAYSVQLAGMPAPATGTKPITRQILALPGAACQ